MTFDFAGNECEAFSISDTFVIESQAVPAAYDAAQTRCAIRVGGGSLTSFAQTPILTARTTAWTHFEWYIGSLSGAIGANLLQLHNAADTPVFRLSIVSGVAIQPQYWNGSTFVNIGGTLAVSNGVKYIFDLEVVCGAAGSFRLFQGGGLVSSGSANMAAVTDISRRRWNASVTATTTQATYISQCLCSDLPTTGHKYYTKPPTANSATNIAWTGGFADVDELVLTQADFIESTAIDQVETFTGAAVTLPAGVGVKAVVVSTQARNAPTGPQNMQAALRKGGVNYFSATIPGITVGYEPALHFFALDPATGLAWTAADAAAATLEFGVKSIP